MAEAKIVQIQQEEEEASLKAHGLSAADYAELQVLKTERNIRAHPTMEPTEIDFALQEWSQQQKSTNEP